MKKIIKSKSRQTEKDPGRDLKTFEKLPAKSKELMVLEEQAKRATGRKSVELNQKIRDKSK